MAAARKHLFDLNGKHSMALYKLLTLPFIK
jgi:hypothetical protein